MSPDSTRQKRQVAGEKSSDGNSAGGGDGLSGDSACCCCDEGLGAEPGSMAMLRGGELVGVCDTETFDEAYILKMALDNDPLLWKGLAYNRQGNKTAE